MNPVTAVVTFLIIWWTVLFAVLPIGVRGQGEVGEVEPGTEPGAPAAPKLGRKLRTTTVIAFGIWVVFVVIVQFDVIGLDDIPIGPTPGVVDPR